MIDVHCHLNFKAFENDTKEVIEEAKKVGVTTIINVGTKIDSSEKAVELTKQYENLYAIVGVHPHHADKHLLSCHPERSEGSSEGAQKDSSASPQNDKEQWLKQLEKLAKQPKVVAIGEIGMDFYRYQSNGVVDVDLQKEVFVKQIELAHTLKLPLQIHNRHAGKEILNILLGNKSLLSNPPGMFHCFSGDVDFLKKVLNLDFCVGFDGNSTYKGLAPGETTELKELINYTPLNRIVIETDAPFLTPVPHRGKRNEPKYAILVGEFIAQTKGVSFDEVDSQTTQNVQKMFSL